MKKSGVIPPVEIEKYKEKYTNVQPFTTALEQILKKRNTSIKYLSKAKLAKAEQSRILHGAERNPPYAPKYDKIVRIKGAFQLSDEEFDELLLAANPRLALVRKLSSDGWDSFSIDVVLYECGYATMYTKELDADTDEA